MEMISSDPNKTIVFCEDRAEWRAWLSEHFETDSEVWFVFPTIDSGEKGVSYNDAVEEALCFGWIDGQAGTLDETHQLRRFTPRRKGSTYSQPNIERLMWLGREGMIHPKVRPSVETLIRGPFVFPEDILEAIRKDPEAWAYYQTFTEPYKRIRVAYIDAARKRPAEFEKRLANFIKKTRENKLIIGYGGIEKYYRQKEEPMKQVFESERISFVEVSETLAKDYLIMVNDDEHVNRFIRGRVGGSREPYNEAQEIEWVRKKLADKTPVFSMIEKESGAFIGNIELMDVHDGCGELGIALTAAKQDQGFGTEGVRAFLKYVFEEMGLQRIVLRTNLENARAFHVYEKCGFREYNRTDVHICMEIMRESI